MTLALFPEKELPPLNEQIAAVTGLTSRQIRMLRLAESALKEALEPLDAPLEIPLFLAGPEPVTDRPPAITEDFVDLLQSQSGIAVDVSNSAVFPTGRAGGMQALGAAIEYLEQGGGELALLGGIDTYLDLYLLGTLDLEERVLAEGVMDGFAPGEGAGFLLLATDDGCRKHNINPIAAVGMPGIAEEPGHRYSEEPYKGDGLAEAFQLAVNGNAAGPIKTLFGSLNGENFGAKEWGVATMRNQQSLDENYVLEHPADCYGDIGAASAPVLIGLAAIGMREGYVSGPCLAWCSSEYQQRGAAIVTN